MVEGQHGHDLGGPVSAYSPAAQQGTETTIVSQLTYLGVILSYVDAATATVEHRLQVAEVQRARLLKVLHSRTLPLGKRESICGLPVCVIPRCMVFI